MKEGVDSNAVITLEALEDHPDFAFTVTVLTLNGSATREHYLCTYTIGQNMLTAVAVEQYYRNVL